MHFKNQDDKTLVMLTLAGEQEAYETLVSRYQRVVIASAMKITHSQFMAEDSAQDAFVTAWMKLDTLEEQEKYGSWVCRIAKNCALNMVRRYSSFVSVDLSEYGDIADDKDADPEHRYVASEERDELHTAISKLSEKVRTIIQLYYFEGFSIVDIADRMRISQGTVKWQLHDGRRKIRKELCAMNEKWNDTLVERVMKKVEELKLWRVKNCKDGFEVIYKDVLREVEELPESAKKYHALADVWGSGWWWTDGDKSDEHFAKIKEAAIKGKNEDIMIFVIAREDEQVPKDARTEFMKTKQIPMLEEAGFTKALAYEWFWLGYKYLENGRNEEGKEALNKVLSIADLTNEYYVLASKAVELFDKKNNELKNKHVYRYQISYGVEKYRYIDRHLCRWDNISIGDGYVQSVDTDVRGVFYNSSLCDGKFFADISVGEEYIGSDKSKLVFLNDKETVDTPAGVFENCQLWKTVYTRNMDVSVYLTWYKDGVGIVKHSHTIYGNTETMVLSSCDVIGGTGLLPMAKGNKWHYVCEFAPEYAVSVSDFEVVYTDKDSVGISRDCYTERISYNMDSWFDMIQAIRNEYFDRTKSGSEKLTDTTKYIERAETLAKTPMEKAHTKLACSLARRLMKTAKHITPDSDITGHWNFFSREAVSKKDGTVKIHSSRKWNFEWKNTGSLGNAGQPVLYNDIYGILQDATNCIWSDEWRVGATPTVEYTCGPHSVKTKISCEKTSPITTKSGTFDDCIKLTLDIEGMNDGWAYRGGNKAYYFAKGIGIVRCEHEFSDGARIAVYELASYKGEGDGYMPICNGMERHYEAIELTDGYIATADYVYVEDETKNTVIFEDKTGIRRIQAPVTQYSYIKNELLTTELWNNGKHKEAHMQFAANSLNLLIHFIARPSYNAWDAKRSIELHKYNMALIESAGDGKAPDGFVGLYGWVSLVRSAAHFGNGEKEDGYKYLEIALDHFERWNSFEKGTELSAGNEVLFGGAKIVKGKGHTIFANGVKEPLEFEYRIDPGMWIPYNSMAENKSWAWFDSAREEERFKTLCSRALELMKNK
ncbi:MAG: RNA polymerase sigma factor [Clostridia bacterium]|nr:RNA polymerase sigma factor [Clostridia bacterium]